ncbi:MAG: hypothetical protein KDB56_09310 [Mycobacterium sp.]|nr:hypothetical protein [Mycobacterium sp.]
MNVSLRSQMVAGVAALGAAAVAVTPIAQPELLSSPQRVASAVELSALVNPITAIAEAIQGINYFTLSQEFVPESLVWPDNFYGVDFIYAPLNIGIVPDLVNQLSTGSLVGLINNISGYAYAGITGAFFLGGGVANSVFNTPMALVTAVGELIAGDPQAALDTLVAEIVAPLQAGVEGAIASVGYIVDNVIENIQTVVTSTLPYLVTGAVDAVVGGISYLAASTVATVTQVVSDLAALDFEAAWNDAVNGILGADGTLGNLVRLGLGLGIIEDVEGEPTVTIPSLRSVFTSELQRLGGQKWWGDGGITNDAFDPYAESAAAVAADPAPAAAVKAAPAAAAAAAALESAPAESPAAPEVEVEAPAQIGESVAAEAASDAPAVADKPVRSAARGGARAAAGDGAVAGTPKRSAHRGGAKAAAASRSAD